LSKGEKRLSGSFGESANGKDPSAIAERKGNEYLIQGERKFVLNAPLANDFIMLFKEPKEDWITLIVEKKEGIQIQPVEKMGLRMIPFGDLQMKGVQVPVGRRVGREGEGIAQADHFRQAMGLRNAAQALGIAQGAFDRAMQYAKQREQFGRKLSQFQAIRHKLSDMVVGIEVARWLTYKSANDYDQGKIDPAFLAVTQLEVERKLTWIVDEALQIFGGYGYMVEQDIEHYYRDAWAIGAQLGTEERQKDVIALKTLGS
jgi:alkylation response protein AidB-like acyl-CoA dehydrogenase